MKAATRFPLVVQTPPSQRISFLQLSVWVILATLSCSAFGQTLTTLYSFGAIRRDGLAPGSGVIVDKNGNLFGTTGVGGRGRNNGTVFELSPPAVEGQPWTETILHRFNGTPDGRIAESHLVMNSDGALFGTTLLGGIEGEGTAYMLTPPAGQTNWKKKIIHNFGSVPNDIVTPNFGLLLAPEGLYGVDQGGANGFGAVYLLTPPAPHRISWTQHILYSFQGSNTGDAALPDGDLVQDSKGNFFGVTGLGGVNNLGAVYEVSPPAVQGGQWTEQVLFSFNGTNGTLPAGPIVVGPGGILYGTTEGGGASGAGTVFELDPPAKSGGAWTETLLHEFSGADGTNPENGVIEDPAGRLLGTAGGVIFMLTPPNSPGGQWTENVLHTFTGPDGFVTSTPLTVFNNALYGTTAEGGAFGTGTVFQLTLP